MGLFAFLFKTPIGIIISMFSGVIMFAVIVVVVVGVMAFSGGPAACTPGGGVIVIDAANADSFDAKWDQLDAALGSGDPGSIVLNESEVSSRANEYIDSKASDLGDVQVCIHNGVGEVTGEVDVFVGTGKFKVTGTVDLSTGVPVVDFQDIEVGNVPGFVLGPFESAVEDAIQELLNDLDLDHTYVPTLTEGQAQIDGTP